MKKQEFLRIFRRLFLKVLRLSIGLFLQPFALIAHGIGTAQGKHRSKIHRSFSQRTRLSVKTGSIESAAEETLFVGSLPEGSRESLPSRLLAAAFSRGH